jgi:hypothetical protein
MGIKALLSKPFGKWTAWRVNSWKGRAVETQQRILKQLVRTAASTSYGRDHGFRQIENYNQYRAKVPVRDYEALKPYIDRILQGERDVLWPGAPLYLSKTSGTTSGAKYIPISKESMPHHIAAARNALLLYVAQTGNSAFADGKMIFLQGSPQLSTTAGIPTGRLSGIVAHHVPAYLQKNRLPSFATNCIDDWETKVDAVIEETMHQPMTLISGIPSWVQHYFEKLLLRTGKETIREVFPQFSLFVYGGVNFEPYRARFEKLIGGRIPSIETYPASEGFIAFQDDQNDPALLLNTDAGIFFEFIPADAFFEPNPPRLPLWEVQTGVNYALVLSTNAGLWGYSIGDTVKFTSTKPYKLLVTGRIKHFTSAFGEHVIAEEVEEALRRALPEYGGSVIEFTVAPQLNPSAGELPYHEWLIAFAERPTPMDAFAERLDSIMQEKNIYYADLIRGKILQPLRITTLQADAFNHYMKSQGKLGGQNKVPRLSNDRNIADALCTWQEGREHS